MKKIALIIISAVLCVAIIAVCIAVYKSNTPPSDGSESVTKEQSEVTKEPGDNTKEPEDSTKEPGEVTKEPGDSTKEPEDSTKAPDDNTKAPDESTQTPGDDTKTPGGESGGKPGDDTGEPGSESGSETGTPHEHSFGEWKTVKSASCTEAGKKERTCACGEKETETVPMTAHTEVTDPAVAATCTTDGKSEGKHCSVCGKVIVAQQILAAHHTEVADPAVEATCTKTGLTAGKHCSVCGKVLVAQTTVPMKSHTYDDKNDTTCNVCGYVRDVACTHTETETVKGHDATCTAPGLTDGKKCKKCGEILTEQKTIPAKGHTEVTDAAVPATCTKTGLTEGKHCSTCGEVTVAQRTVDALPHNFDDNKAEIVISADGSSAIKRLPCKNCPTNTDLPFSGYYVSGKNAYKFDSNGKRETLEASFVDFDGNTYYVINNIIVINYFVIDGKIYDFGDDGKMINKIFDEGLITIDGNVYLVEKNNTVATGTRLVGDRFYSFGDDGKQDKTDFDHQYVTVGKDQYYVINNIIVKNYFIIDGKVIDFGSDGKKRDTVINNKIIPVGDRKYYVVNNIIIINIFVFSDGHIYRFGSDGAMLVSTKDGNYVFGADGAMNSSGKTTYVEVDDTLYEVSGSTAKKHEHKYSSETVEPTCTEDGHTTNTCDCGDSNTKKIPAKGHTEATLPAVKETCTTDGKTEGKYCSECKKTLVEQKTIPAHHTEVVDPAVAATCETAGKTEGKHCSVCEKILVEQKEIPAKGHTEVVDPAVAATCETAGKTEGKHCSVCEKILVEQTVIPAKGHTEVIDAAVAATCEKAGKTAGKHCSVCKKTLVEQKEIPAKGHTEVIEAAVAATCEKAGKTAGKHCSVCNKVLVAQTVIPAKNHNYVNGVCSNCGEKAKFSQGLEFTLNSDGKSYSVSGIGTCKDTDIIIPDTYENLPVTSIGAYAFAYLTGLTSITIPNSVTSIAHGALSDCTGLTSINVDSKNAKYHSVNNCLIETTTKTLIASCKNSVIPSDGSVTIIGTCAFAGFTGLTSITIPDGVTLIGDLVFRGCTDLTSITIPNSVTYIGDFVFSNCTKLETIIFKGTKKQWNNIETGSYWNNNAGTYTVIFA